VVQLSESMVASFFEDLHALLTSVPTYAVWTRVLRRNLKKALQSVWIEPSSQSVQTTGLFFSRSRDISL